MTVFDLRPLEEGRYTVCYATSRSTRGDDPVAKDFHYKAGEIEVGSELMSCDFEEDMCDLMIYRDHEDMDLYWVRHSGSTETPGTGPSFDHTYGTQRDGSYIYMDSPGYVAGASATLIGPPTIFPQGLFCARLWYHMWGDDVNSLRLYMHELKGDQDATGNWGKPRLLRVGDHGDEWLEGGFEFHSDGKTAQQLVIESLAGFSEKGDIAVDDLRIVQGRCPEEIKRDSYNADYICGEVRLLTGSWSQEKSWFVEGAVSCAGRGYSYDNLKGNWVPCCVPRYGQYTLVLHDGFGDGWSGSKLEFRFFDQVQEFGSDFMGIEEGVEKKYTLNIGLLQITRIEGSQDRIALEIQVAQSNSYVWCGAALSGSPAPTVEVLKKYGIRSQEQTKKPGDKLRMEIANKPNDRRILQPSTDYNIYCYAEPASYAADQNQVMMMDDSQVAASRIMVTTDNKPPEITVESVDEDYTEASVRIRSDEVATVWCAAEEVSKVPTDDIGQSPPPSVIKKAGNKIQIVKGTENTPQILKLKNLMPDTTYRVYCYAEDRALPKPNFTGPEQVNAKAFDLVTPSKVPELKIESYKAFVRGFKLSVKTDTPAKVWCGAAMAGSAFPKKEDVKRVGATGEVTDITKSVDLEIRGVPPNTRYSIYCMAASRSGASEMTDQQMWDGALEVTSFGKFCDMPIEPAVLSEGPATPFDPLTPPEEFMVRDFMNTQKNLKLEGIYRINLFLDKDAILNHFEKGAEFPKRYARVRAGVCNNGKGAYRQFKVGPLDTEDAKNLKLEDIGDPVETDCGGYNPQGVFGRRLLDQEQENELDAFLHRVFGFHFGVKACVYGEVDNCLNFGPLIYKQKGEQLEEVWIGLKTPPKVQGDFEHNLPFYIIAEPPLGDEKVDVVNPESRDRIALLLEHVKGYSLNGVHFDSLDDMLEVVDTEANPELTVEKLRNAMDQVKSRREEQRANTVRRLAPYNIGPNPKGREGLEYRVGPEHIEPQGKRYTITHNPDSTSYSISYAGWTMTVTNDRDTSLKIWNLRFKDQRYAFELGVNEALAHYSVAERHWYFMDSWYGGLGAAARRVHPGIECAKTGTVLFWDKSLCVFEEDKARPLRSHWKAGVLRDAVPHYALVLRQIITVSNYDYITDYIFHQSGFFEATMAFTGELYAGVEVPWYSARQASHGTQVTGSMRMGALHAHLASWKVDFDLDDYKSNSIVWHEIKHDTARPGALKIDTWFAETEEQAYYKFNNTRPLHYQVVNEEHNVYGNVGGFTVLPLPTVAIPNPEFELYTGPAAWAKYRILTTLRKEEEFHGSLPRDNKYALRPAVSIDRYIRDNEPIRKKDVVTWIASSVWHIPVIEDMPQTLSLGNTLGFLVKPHNFFTEDPSMDLHNSLGGAVQDPGTCAIIRQETEKYLQE
ncbi:hypothetical protein NCLIV_013880 [Neospora caninum Liverpool]|nr:hypothetical protein NCLIV_013880 [Neospora caninum Liverpool]CBZ51594.1 hypothetical protein NCLIV_013880 [Neospora caninum Liverpool]|eukprot:XP_003881627.1 hypothetical protein NCLIV_013880 [Neospora caninum Liverpool]